MLTWWLLSGVYVYWCLSLPFCFEISFFGFPHQTTPPLGMSLAYSRFFCPRPRSLFSYSPSRCLLLLTFLMSPPTHLPNVFSYSSSPTSSSPHSSYVRWNATVGPPPFHTYVQSGYCKLHTQPTSLVMRTQELLFPCCAPRCP